jgi:hypothetical protein
MIRDCMQRRNLKDDKCFDRELWRNKVVFGLRKTAYSQKNWYIYTRIYIYIIINQAMCIVETHRVLCEV